MAHNGNQYDFPLLKAELKKVGVTLPCGTLCADSYLGMKEIFKKEKKFNILKMKITDKPGIAKLSKELLTQVKIEI